MSNNKFEYCRKCGVKLRHNGFYCNCCQEEIDKDFIRKVDKYKEKACKSILGEYDKDLSKYDYP